MTKPLNKKKSYHEEDVQKLLREYWEAIESENVSKKKEIVTEANSKPLQSGIREAAA